MNRLDWKEVVDDMVTDKVNRRGKRLKDLSYLEKLSKWQMLKKRFKALADPDALALIPDLVYVFEDKKKEILSIRYEPEFEGELLEWLSSLRRDIGFDRRAREIKGKPRY